MPSRNPFRSRASNTIGSTLVVRFAKVSATHGHGGPWLVVYHFDQPLHLYFGCFSRTAAGHDTEFARHYHRAKLREPVHELESAYGFFSGLIFARFPILEHFDNIHVLDQSLLTEAPFFDFGDV